MSLEYIPSNNTISRAGFYPQCQSYSIYYSPVYLYLNNALQEFRDPSNPSLYHQIDII